MLGEGSHSQSRACPLPEGFLSEVNMCTFVDTCINNSEKTEESALRKVGGGEVLARERPQIVVMRNAKFKRTGQAQMFHYVTR